MIKSKLRIGMVCFPSYGGSGALAVELGKKLAKKGHKVYFISSAVPFRLVGPWQKNVFYQPPYQIDYPLFAEHILDPLLLINKIVELAKKEKIDVFHAHYALPFGVNLAIAKEILKSQGIKIKIVTTFHGTDVSKFADDPGVSEVLGYSIRRNDALTAVCKATSELAQNYFNLSKSPRVIYNFVEIKREPEAKNKELRSIFATNNERIIIHISNFREVKRLQDVITIFNNINKKIPSKLILVGDGPEQKTAQKYAAKYKLINKIHFMGFQTLVGKMLSISDLFLLPSELEAFNLSALESMSCRIPVAASAIGGMAEMIEDGINGILAPVGDIKTMSTKVINLFSQPTLYRKMALNAHNKVIENYNARKITGQYEDLYYELIK